MRQHHGGDLWAAAGMPAVRLCSWGPGLDEALGGDGADILRFALRDVFGDDGLTICNFDRGAYRPQIMGRRVGTRDKADPLPAVEDLLDDLRSRDGRVVIDLGLDRVRIDGDRNMAALIAVAAIV
jgi:hypothetical protein